LFPVSRRETYIHGTAPDEQDRLRALNRFTNQPFLALLEVQPGSMVLEVGSGLGLLAADVAATADRVRVVGVERSRAQLAAAIEGPRVQWVQGDAHELPFADRTFDLGYARYVLEHVRNPLAMLQAMRRVVKIGGRIAVMENDISLVRFDPACPVFEQVWRRFADLQQALGGDPFVGRRLHALLVRAGLSQVALSVEPEVHWYGSPRWRWWVGNIIGNVQSARHALVERGFSTGAHVDDAIAELRRLIDDPEASATFVWDRAVCYRERA
jgi:SAM-dependent methyltransferase